MKVLSRKLNFRVIILTLFVLTSGSVLNILGIDEILVSTLFVGVFLRSIRAGVLARRDFTVASLLTLLVLIILFALQAIDGGDSASIFNRNNVKIVLLMSTCLLASHYLGSRGNFIDQLHLVLLVFIVHGIASCAIFSFFPTQNVLFSAVDLKSRYLGYWPLVLQRAPVNYFGSASLMPTDFFGIKVFRAHGLAWEPGNFASYVNVFVFVNLFIRKSSRSVILGVVALILAFSSTGLLVLIMQFAAFAIINSRNVLRKNTILKLFLLPIASFMVVTLSLGNLNEKLYGDRSGSGATRFVDTVSALFTIYNNPFLGTGLAFTNYSSELNKSLEISREALSTHVAADRVSALSFTNSFLALYVQFGVPVALLFTVGLFRQTLIPRHKYIFGLVLIGSVSSAPLMLTPFYLLFVMSGLLNLWKVKNTS